MTAIKHQQQRQKRTRSHQLLYLRPEPSRENRQRTLPPVTRGAHQAGADTAPGRAAAGAAATANCRCRCHCRRPRLLRPFNRTLSSKAAAVAATAAAAAAATGKRRRLRNVIGRRDKGGVHDGPKGADGIYNLLLR